MATSKNLIGAALLALALAPSAAADDETALERMLAEIRARQSGPEGQGLQAAERRGFARFERRARMRALVYRLSAENRARSRHRRHRHD